MISKSTNINHASLLATLFTLVLSFTALNQATAKNMEEDISNVNYRSIQQNTIFETSNNDSKLSFNLKRLDKNNLPSQKINLRFDIAENGSRFAFDSEPVDENGLPAYGGEFITEGYLYPFGFLENNIGVNEDGSPAFPEQVLGRWICRGWHVGEGASTVTGPWVVTTQLFDLNDTHGRVTIVTDGFELADINKPIDRAITGGTGRFSSVKGSSTQKLLGFNQSYGVNVRVILKPQN